MLREDVKRSTEGAVSRINVETRKWAMILRVRTGIYWRWWGTGPKRYGNTDVDVKTWSCAEAILSYVKTNLQVHSGDCPIRKLC